MKQLIWKIQNALRVVICFALSAFWITLALLALLVTWDRRIPLMMAHYLWAPSILFGVGSHVEVLGLNNIDLSKPYIFVMNHQSTLDIPCVYKAIPVPLRFIVKNELRAIPFLSQYISAMGMIFIDRSNRESAIRSLKRAGAIIRNGASIIAYPEGTRSEDGRIQFFKKGIFVLAIEAGVEIVPIAIEGSRHAMPKNKLELYPQTIRINIGKPIASSNYTQTNKSELMDRIRDQMIKLNIAIGGPGGNSGHHKDVIDKKQAA